MSAFNSRSSLSTGGFTVNSSPDTSYSNPNLLNISSTSSADILAPSNLFICDTETVIFVPLNLPEKGSVLSGIFKTADSSFATPPSLSESFARLGNTSISNE